MNPLSNRLLRLMTEQEVANSLKKILLRRVLREITPEASLGLSKELDMWPIVQLTTTTKHMLAPWVALERRDDTAPGIFGRR